MVYTVHCASIAVSLCALVLVLVRLGTSVRALLHVLCVSRHCSEPDDHTGGGAGDLAAKRCAM